MLQEEVAVEEVTSMRWRWPGGDHAMLQLEAVEVSCCWRRVKISPQAVGWRMRAEMRKTCRPPSGPCPQQRRMLQNYWGTKHTLVKMRDMHQGDGSFLGGWGRGGGKWSPFSTLRDESPAGLHLDVQASLHGAHLHVLVQVSVHVALCCGQFHLRWGRLTVTQEENNRRRKLLDRSEMCVRPLSGRWSPGIPSLETWRGTRCR